MWGSLVLVYALHSEGPDPIANMGTLCETISRVPPHDITVISINTQALLSLIGQLLYCTVKHFMWGPSQKQYFLIFSYRKDTRACG